MNNFSCFFCTFSQCFLLAAIWLLFSCCFLLLLSPPFGPLPLASVRPQIAQSTWNVNAVWFGFHSRDLYCTIAPTNTELYSTIYGCIYIAVSRSSILDSRYSISRAFSAAVRSVCGWVKVLSFTHELLDAACAARPWIFHESLLEIFRPRLRCRLPLPLLRLCLCRCAQRWESNCCGFLRWRWGCVCSPVSDWGWVCGMRSWGSPSWRRFAELKNATSNGSSCVLLYLLLLRGWLGISSSQGGAALGVAGVLNALFARFLFVLLLRVTVWHLFLLPLSFSHSLWLSRSQRRRLWCRLLSTEGDVSSLMVGVSAKREQQVW